MALEKSELSNTQAFFFNGRIWHMISTWKAMNECVIRAPPYAYYKSFFPRPRFLSAGSQSTEPTLVRKVASALLKKSTLQRSFYVAVPKVLLCFIVFKRIKKNKPLGQTPKVLTQHHLRWTGLSIVFLTSGSVPCQLWSLLESLCIPKALRCRNASKPMRQNIIFINIQVSLPKKTHVVNDF